MFRNRVELPSTKEFVEQKGLSAIAAEKSSKRQMRAEQNSYSKRHGNFILIQNPPMQPLTKTA